jgi:hypothetical protein
MKLYLARLGILLCLASCGPTAERTLKGNNASPQDSAGANPAPTSEESAKSPWFVEWRKQETGNFKHFPDRASRADDLLTISFRGKPVASFSEIDNTECEGNGTCSLWQFAGQVVLQSSPGKTETFAIVAHNNGEQNSNLLVNSKGDIHWVGSTFQVSPDLRFLVVGEQENIISKGFLEVVDFASVHHAMVARFDAQCDPHKWEKAEAEVICSRDDTNSVEVAGVVEQLAPGKWRLREHTVQKNDDNTAVTLRSQIVKMTADQPSADPTADDAYERKLGYRRLTD